MDVTKVNENRINEAQIRGQAEAGKTQGAASAESTKNAKKATPQGISKIDHAAAKVEWSPEAEVAVEGLNAAKEAPSVRTEKVAALKAAIANGTYKMDSQKIADAMIQRNLEEGILTRKS